MNSKSMAPWPGLAKFAALSMVCALAAVVALGEGFLARAAFAHDEIFVPNQENASITVYTRTASGDTAPVRTLSGENTGMRALRAVVVDTLHDELVVSNDPGSSGEASITVYSRTASGDTAPLRTLQGPSTGLGGPKGIVVDTLHDELVVANASGTVTVYARTASGDATPLRTLSGPNTGLSPFGAVVDTVHDELVIGNSTIDHLGERIHTITVYARTASGDTAPLRTLQITHPLGTVCSKCDSATLGVVVDTVNDELLVAVSVYPELPGSSYINVYARTASGNTAPLRTLQGPSTGLIRPTGLIVDTVHDELLVASELLNTISTYARTASGDTPPLRALVGPNTGLRGPDLIALALDTTPPSTTVTLTPASPNGNNGWYTGSVSLAFSATDPDDDGSTLQTKVQLDGGTIQNATSLVVSNSGAHTVTYWSADPAGNAETPKSVSFKIDNGLPTTTATVTGAGANGWFTGTAQVTLASTDAESGIDKTYYAIDGGAVQTYTGPFSVSGDGSHTVAYWSVDLAGNESSPRGSLAMRVDSAAPTITASATPSTLWSPNNKLVAVTVSGNIADAGSGIDPSTAQFTVIDSYGLVQPSGSVTLAADGSFSFQVLLEARRTGQDLAGRFYVISITAKDQAGNTTTVQLTVTVAHDRG